MMSGTDYRRRQLESVLAADGTVFGRYDKRRRAIEACVEHEIRVQRSPDARFRAFHNDRLIQTNTLFDDGDLAEFFHEVGHIIDLERHRLKIDAECASWRIAMKLLRPIWNQEMLDTMDECLRSYHSHDDDDDDPVIAAVLTEGAAAQKAAARVIRVDPRFR